MPWSASTRMRYRWTGAPWRPIRESLSRRGSGLLLHTQARLPKPTPSFDLRSTGLSRTCLTQPSSRTRITLTVWANRWLTSFGQLTPLKTLSGRFIQCCYMARQTSLWYGWCTFHDCDNHYCWKPQKHHVRPVFWAASSTGGDYAPEWEPPSCLYIGADPMTITHEQLITEIVEPSEDNTPCSICPPWCGKVWAHFDSNDQFEMLSRWFWKIDGNPLWAKLHGLVCPTTLLDQTISLRQYNQVIQDASGHIRVLPLKDYYAYYMHCCVVLYPKNGYCISSEGQGQIPGPH